MESGRGSIHLLIEVGSVRISGERGKNIVAFVCAAAVSASYAVNPSACSTGKPIPQPSPKKNNPVIDISNRILVESVIGFFDLARIIRKTSGNRKEALNVDPFDLIPNSAWWTERNSCGRLSPVEIERGPGADLGLDTSGQLLLFEFKNVGATFGFNVEDRHGRRYILKFDPPGYPELGTGAEAVSTRLLYAAGYNVPENHVVVFDPSRVIIGESVTWKAWRERRKLTRKDLDSLLARLDRLPGGRIRALSSRFIDGIPLGGWRFRGTRGDDSNDLIPHEHRREIRAFRILASWINHYDSNIDNTLDIFDTGCRRVVHFYIDFNSTLGSFTTGPRSPDLGNEVNFSLIQILRNTVMNPFSASRWETEYRVVSPSVGAFDADHFRPDRFRFNIPAQAYDNMTARDGLWGAKLVMSFTDDQIEAAVRGGRYSNQADKRYMARVLRERRDIIGRFYIRDTSPIDSINVTSETDGSCCISFVDLGIGWGFAKPSETTYRVRLRNAITTSAWKENAEGPCSRVRLPGKSLRGCGESELLVETVRSSRSGKELPISIILHRSGDSGAVHLAGLLR